MMERRWKIDLHSHTWHSRDCPVSPERLARAALRRGLDGIAITNHSRFVDHDAVQAAAGPHFHVIPGEEVYSSEGEIIGLFLHKEIPAELSPEKTCEAIHAQGGIVVIPHPYDRLRKGAIGAHVLDRLVHAGMVDAIEGFNGRMMLPQDNWAAQKYAAAHQIPTTVGSDGHSTWEYGESFLAISPFTDAASFLENLPDAEPHRHRSPQWVHFVSTFAKRRWKANHPSEIPPDKPLEVAVFAGENEAAQ